MTDPTEPAVVPDEDGWSPPGYDEQLAVEGNDGTPVRSVHSHGDSSPVDDDQVAW